MKITPKPLTVVHRPDVPAIAALVTDSKAPRAQVVERAYQQLVTRQDIHPDRAKHLLGLRK